MANALSNILRRQIQLSGPLGLDSFMQVCLHHDPHGYYFAGEGIGRDGDFITAPEISPLFGQSIAAWITEEWQLLGKPKQWRMVELGPGRGTLMAETLANLSCPPTALQMVEASPAFQEKIENRLDRSAQFVSDLGMLPESSLPTIFIGNEYLDALPIRQFQRLDGKIGEICVGLSQDGNKLRFVSRAAEHQPCPLPPGEDGFWEVNLAAQTHTKFLCAEVVTAGGAGLFIDYGYASTPGIPTFQALHKHEKVDPLSAIGQADLTALVDFATLQKIIQNQGLKDQLESQHDFLIRNGLSDLLDSNPDQAAAAARLLREDGMGTLFQALSFRAPPP